MLITVDHVYDSALASIIEDVFTGVGTCGRSSHLLVEREIEEEGGATCEGKLGGRLGNDWVGRQPPVLMINEMLSVLNRR